MKKRIVIVDDDEKYIANLELILLTREEDLIDLEVVTGEYFQEYFSQSRNIDCLIINEKYYTSVVQKQKFEFVFLLSYSQQEETFNARRGEKIYKYSSVKEIFHKIIGKLGLPVDARKEKTGERNSNGSQMIMVYSPVGGVGKTSVALSLCYQLSLLNKNVLYINVGDIQNHPFYLNKEGYVENSFERMLHTKDANILNILETVVWHLEFDCLKPFRGTKESYGINAENYLYLIDKIKQNGAYDFVIIDGDNSFGKFNGELMAKSDKLLVVVDSSLYVNSTLNLFLNYVRNVEKEKMIFVCNKYNYGMVNTTDYSIIEYVPQFVTGNQGYLQEWYHKNAMKDTALLLV